MKLTKGLFLSSALVLSRAAALPGGNRTGGIAWGPCSFDGLLPIVCGNVSVPMDYTDPQGTESLVLQVVKVPAVASQSRGSILFNFGGPGGEGQRTLATAFAGIFMNVTGGEHDLIAFDPRGAGTSIPFSCSESAEAAKLVQWAYREVATNASDVAMGQLWAQAKTKSDACQNGPGNATARLIGTPFTARDFIQVVDALGEDGMLRYWGFSYGTTLGATIAAMFPERVDRMVLDGVMNVHEYYNGDVGSLQDADELLRAFVDECIADPELCELGRNVTGDELEMKIYDLIEAVKYKPVPLSSGLIDYTSLKASIFSSLYSPIAWPIVLAPALQSLLTGNLSNTAALAYLSTDLDYLPSYPDTQVGIQCLDKNGRFTELEQFRPHVNAVEAQSRLYGENHAALAIRCARWGFESKEPYTGNLSAKTQHPVLLIGNTLDPITPLAGAHNLSASLEDSVVLEQKGYGHTSTSQTSTCTQEAIREYFRTGKLPEPGTQCDVDSKRVFKIGDDSVAAALLGRFL